jgi:hypothetical protein
MDRERPPKQLDGPVHKYFKEQITLFFLSIGPHDDLYHHLVPSIMINIIKKNVPINNTIIEVNKYIHLN